MTMKLSALRRKTILLFSAALVCAFQPAHAGQFTLSNTAWERAGKSVGVDPYLLYAVALVESMELDSHRQNIRPSPYVIRFPDGPRFPTNQEDAKRLLAAVSPGKMKELDIGLLQINVGWNGHRVASADMLLDPEINLKVGAVVLAEAIQSAPGDLELGVGHFHHWREEAVARSYGS